MVKLPSLVETNDVLRRIVYFNAFSLGDMLKENVSDEALSMALISSIGTGRFAYEEEVEDNA